MGQDRPRRLLSAMVGFYGVEVTPDTPEDLAEHARLRYQLGLRKETPVGLVRVTFKPGKLRVSRLILGGIQLPYAAPPYPWPHCVLELDGEPAGILIVLRQQIFTFPDLPLHLEMIWHPEFGENIAIRGLTRDTTAKQIGHIWQARRVSEGIVKSAGGGRPRKLGGLSDEDLILLYRELGSGKASLATAPDFAEWLDDRYGLTGIDPNHSFDDDTLLREVAGRFGSWAEFQKRAVL